MNRYKKEVRKRAAEQRKGLTPQQIALLDARDGLQERVESSARGLHFQIFPEESDFYLDSYVDAIARSAGRNPMSSEYIREVELRRQALGVLQLTENGGAQSNETVLLCERQARCEQDSAEPLIACSLSAQQIGRILWQLNPMDTFCSANRGMEDDYEAIASCIRKLMDEGHTTAIALREVLTDAFGDKLFQSEKARQALRHMQTLLQR